MHWEHEASHAVRLGILLSETGVVWLAAFKRELDAAIRTRAEILERLGHPGDGTVFRD